MDRGQDLLMKVESTAPGKIFLSGEYLVLDGALATIMSTKQRVKVTIEDIGDIDNIFYCSIIDQHFPFNVDNNYQINWLDKNQPDILCLQETKQDNDKFPHNEFKSLNWFSYHNGQKTYNGSITLKR